MSVLRAASTKFAVAITFDAQIRYGSSTASIGPEIPPAWTIFRIPCSAIRLHASSTLPIAPRMASTPAWDPGGGAGSRPMIRWPDCARVHAKGKPISPLEPVTRMVCKDTVIPLCRPAEVELYHAENSSAARQTRSAQWCRELPIAKQSRWRVDPDYPTSGNADVQQSTESGSPLFVGSNRE